MLDKSAAEDKNSIVVTKDTASKYSLKSIADLAAHQADITVAAPPEFKRASRRAWSGLEDQYGFVSANVPAAQGRGASSRR